MKKLQLSEHGFTIIEVLIFVLVIAVIVTLAILNIRDYRATQRDSTYKKDINTIAYNLETYYEKNKYYPSELDEAFKKALDQKILQDEKGIEVNNPGSRYQYKPRSCEATKCQGYMLESPLELEAVYKKESLNQ